MKKRRPDCTDNELGFFALKGSRDGTMCLWCTGIVPSSGCEGCQYINSMPSDEFGLRCTAPILQKKLPEQYHRVRALDYDANLQVRAKCTVFSFGTCLCIAVSSWLPYLTAMIQLQR